MMEVRVATYSVRATYPRQLLCMTTTAEVCSTKSRAARALIARSSRRCAKKVRTQR